MHGGVDTLKRVGYLATERSRNGVESGPSARKKNKTQSKTHAHAGGSCKPSLRTTPGTNAAEASVDAMRALNMEHYRVLLQGQDWTGALPPCSRDAMALLENNESIVSWLAPLHDDGSFAQHIPAVRYANKFWTISLRMSKSIYRNVRLRQGFKNVQTVHGVQTLRIPQLLFNEKQRTQARFKVSPPTPGAETSINLIAVWLAQAPAPGSLPGHPASAARSS